jgi:ABC-type xylose transport system substrate-binding protein
MINPRQFLQTLSLTPTGLLIKVDSPLASPATKSTLQFMDGFIGVGGIRVTPQNDDMALGALEAMKARGIDLATYPVSGVDGAD